MDNQSPLRKWRGARSLEKCASIIGTHLSTLSRLERGKQWLSPDLAEKLTTKTGLTLDEIANRGPAKSPVKRKRRA
jgi:transcriptional regulator with XRE-family HTH domain